MTEEENSFSRRFKRYAHVSSALSGAALRFAGDHFFGFDIQHEGQAKSLAKALGTLKGPVMKIAQILATIPDAVPAEYVQEFLHLQSNAPSMGWPFVKRRMMQELGVQWVDLFQSFEREARFAASLGQVHRAISQDGEVLACKLQYPDMSSIVEADLYQLKIILNLYEKAMGALKTNEVFEEIRERLKEELDYEREAKHISIYSDIFKDFEGVHIPLVKEDLSTQKLLTMSWLEGKNIRDVLEEDQNVRNHLAQKMFYIWYYPFYHYGFIHADPHLGNYTFCPDHKINLLDFGCIRQFSGKILQGVMDLYRGLQNKDQAQLIHAYENLGFSNLSKDLIEILNLWAKLLYEPLLEDKIRPIQWELNGIKGRNTASFVHQELKRAGGITPPGSFVFLDRATVGIGSVFLHLKAQLNWHQEFEILIDHFDVETVLHNQNHLLEKHHL